MSLDYGIKRQLLPATTIIYIITYVTVRSFSVGRINLKPVVIVALLENHD